MNKVIVRESNKFKWYTIVTKFNYEKKFSKDLLASLNNFGLEDYFEDIIIPIVEYKDVKKDKNGKDKIVTKTEKIYPNYVFVKVIMNDRVWNCLRGTAGFSAILSIGGELSTLTEREIINIKKACNIKDEIKFDGEIGDSVVVIEGIFKDYIGSISQIDKQKSKVTIKLENINMHLELGIKDIDLVS